jgi:hypothetical protein
MPELVRSPMQPWGPDLFFAVCAASFSHGQGDDNPTFQIYLKNNKGKAGLKHLIIIKINFYGTNIKVILIEGRLFHEYNLR